MISSRWDNFGIFNDESDCDSFLLALNSLPPCLTSTFEKEADGKLPCLDVLVEKAESEFFYIFYIANRLLLDNMHAGILLAPKPKDEGYSKLSAPGSVYLLQTQATTRTRLHQNYSS